MRKSQPKFPSLLKWCTALSVSMMFAGGALADDGPILVTNGSNAGDGSLRAALEEAADAETAAQILIAAPGTISINETLTYTGRVPLTIVGDGQTVMSANNVTLLAVTEGADLTVQDLHFAGPGNFSINNRGDANGGSKAIFVDVRDDQTGTVTLTLDNVSVKGVANHGIHVSDCNLADDCGGGSGGAGEGSDASITVNFNNVTVDDVGNGGFDADGLRVDERGLGDIRFNAVASLFVNVGADGVELDEGQAGSVIANIASTRFVTNGNYCDPAVLGPFMPSPDEAEFADGERAEADIPGPVTGTPDDRCIEREVDLYESGSVEEYAFGIDLDDGIDIDEAGPGHLYATMNGSHIIGNLDEGVDFDEEQAGDIVVSFINSTANGNRDDGFKMSEEDEGDVFGVVNTSRASANGGKGFVFEEEGDGDLKVIAAASRTSGNDDGDKTGFEVVQEDDGEGSLEVITSSIEEGIDADGVDVE